MNLVKKHMVNLLLVYSTVIFSSVAMAGDFKIIFTGEIERVSVRGNYKPPVGIKAGTPVSGSIALSSENALRKRSSTSGWVWNDSVVLFEVGEPLDIKFINGTVSVADNGQTAIAQSPGWCDNRVLKGYATLPCQRSGRKILVDVQDDTQAELSPVLLQFYQLDNQVSPEASFDELVQGILEYDGDSAIRIDYTVQDLDNLGGELIDTKKGTVLSMYLNVIKVWRERGG